MTEFEITADFDNVDFSPNTEIKEILQNVKTILATRKGTVPLDRNFGIDWSFVDQPIAVAQATLSAEVIPQIKRYEPRAKVIRVGFENQKGAQEGTLRPRVVIGVNL
ncbi:MAG: GPW/gp25 family protein [Methyloprofundus sp.]|nr:GPW/gp25 family protein [Methyloprofundus sp.]